jgi:ABC-type spermidine/putrescine transport system permease subunit II
MRLSRAPNALVAGLVLAYLLFPVVVVLVISFSSATYLKFPPPALSLRWYEKLLHSSEWIESFWLTLEVGALTTVFTTLLGVPAAFALIRLELRGKALVNALLLTALITPAVIRALGSYLFFAPLGLVNSVVGLACAHTVSALPYLVINVAASLKGFDVALERAAVVHGASPLRAIVRITLPIIAPGILVGAIFAFLSSAQELLVAIYLMGTVRKPLAVKMWEGVRESVDPTIAAASTGVIAMAVLAFAAAALLHRRARRLTA